MNPNQKMSKPKTGNLAASYAPYQRLSAEICGEPVLPFLIRVISVHQW